MLGARGLAAAQRLGLPSVAIYQTDMPSYLAQHGIGPVGRGAARAAWRWVRRLHCLADLTLAPSTAALETCARTAYPGLPCGTGRGHGPVPPGWRGDAGTRALRRTLAPDGEVLLGYVGRLAPEKELHRLAEPRRSRGHAWSSSATARAAGIPVRC